MLVNMTTGGTGWSLHIWRHRRIRCYTPLFVVSPLFHIAWLTTLQWCSLCNDVGSILVLCSQCRVGICLLTHETIYGCLRWQEGIYSDGFVFVCPFCAWLKEEQCSVWFHECHVHLVTKRVCYSFALLTRWAGKRGGTSPTDMTRLSLLLGLHGTRRSRRMSSCFARHCGRHTLGTRTTYTFDVCP